MDGGAGLILDDASYGHQPDPFHGHAFLLGADRAPRSSPHPLRVAAAVLLAAGLLLVARRPRWSLLLAAVDKFPFTVYDARGKQVLAGEAGDAAEELPPGDYKVVVKAGNQEVVAPHVNVALGQATTLKLSVKNGTLVIEQ
jgi:hypothetical protein